MRRSRPAGRRRAGRRSRPKNAQKDKDARWTKKHDHSFYGYKNHIGIGRMHKLIRRRGDGCERVSRITHFEGQVIALFDGVPAGTSRAL